MDLVRWSIECFYWPVSKPSWGKENSGESQRVFAIFEGCIYSEWIAVFTQCLMLVVLFYFPALFLLPSWRCLGPNQPSPDHNRPHGAKKHRLRVVPKFHANTAFVSDAEQNTIDRPANASCLSCVALSAPKRHSFAVSKR